MSSPTPHNRHQSSLERVLDFSEQSRLTPTERVLAQDAFSRIVRHYESADDALPKTATTGRGLSYSQPRLLRLMLEFAASDASKDSFLQAFFQAMALPIDAHELPDLDALEPLFRGFADFLMDNFFLPLKASTRQTPQPTPTYHSAVLQAQGPEPLVFIATLDRLSSLRGACLIRDRHRCVISRLFCDDEYPKRYEADGSDARDDDGVLFSEQDVGFDKLEVAHILPHALVKSDASGALDTSREAALAILNMFDKGVVHLINGVDIDRPLNAITLASRLHHKFGAFDIYFDAVPGAAHTYRVQSFLPPLMAAAHHLPVTRTLFVTENHTIDPPSPRLLALHRAIAHILRLSGAGEYIDRVLRDAEDNCVRADGSTELGRLVALGLGGWLNSVVG